MGHSPRISWHQIHASYLCQWSSPRRSGSRVCWIPIGSRNREARHGWKISWHDLPNGSFILESIRWWCSKSERIKSGASFSIPREDYYWDIIKIGLLSHKQWGWIWGSTNGNDHGSKNGRKGSGDVFELKVGRRPSKGRVRSKGCENARILESS